MDLFMYKTSNPTMRERPSENNYSQKCILLYAWHVYLRFVSFRTRRLGHKHVYGLHKLQFQFQNIEPLSRADINYKIMHCSTSHWDFDCDASSRLIIIHQHNNESE